MSSGKSSLETKLVVSMSDLKRALSVPGVSIHDARIVAVCSFRIFEIGIMFFYLD